MASRPSLAPGRGGGRRPPRVPILMYHRLTERPENHPYSLEAARFRTQLALLRALGYRSVSPLDVARAAQTGRPVPGSPVAITFDDGYLDTLTVALPLLQQYGFTAACYLVAERVGRTSDWTDPVPLMGWPEIREWLAAGMEVGSHSLTHRDLTTVSADDLREEVAGSRARLEDRLGLAVRSFAYPFNRRGARELEAVGAAGYEAGCAGPEVSHSVLALPRGDGAARSLARFLVQLLPTYPELRHRVLALRRPKVIEPTADAVARLS